MFYKYFSTLHQSADTPPETKHLEMEQLFIIRNDLLAFITAFKELDMSWAQDIFSIMSCLVDLVHNFSPSLPRTQQVPENSLQINARYQTNFCAGSELTL